MLGFKELLNLKKFEEIKKYFQIVSDLLNKDLVLWIKAGLEEPELINFSDSFIMMHELYPVENIKSDLNLLILYFFITTLSKLFINSLRINIPIRGV